MPRRNQRAIERAFLRRLEPAEREVCARLMPDSMLSMLARLDADEAREEVRQFVEGLEARGYDAERLAECVEGDGDE